ncbi:hypothetical protein DPX44_02645 [Enterobacter cloacae]|nr:hypothetical protein DPX44_02645 [Enterobacter cloacae]
MIILFSSYKGVILEAIPLKIERNCGATIFILTFQVFSGNLGLIRAFFYKSFPLIHIFSPNEA